MGPSVKPQLSQPFVQELLVEAYNNGDANTKETCNWARGVVQAAVQ
jgi:hypothetical protein